MDPTRFDALARSFASGSTRRRLVALVAALPLGRLLAFDEEEAAAERPHDRLKRRNKQHHRKRRNTRKRKHNNNHTKHNNNGGKGGGKPGNCTPNGKACNQNNDCCGGNCFNQVCADPVTACDGAACPPNATGCCSGACCGSPANQCNALGECCAPNCDGRQCGPDGCGNTGTCGTCPSGVVCDESSGTCACTTQCQGKQCGDDGCGGSCGTCPAGQHCNSIGLCEGRRTCNATLCPNGCCDAEGVCRTDQRSCTGGAGSACCAGCCDVSTQQCMPPGSGGCGINGSDCVTCDPLRGICADGKCQCNADFCPNGCCENGPGQPGECIENAPPLCGTGGEQCALCNGQPCTQDSACLSDNCYDGACADKVTQCEGEPCNPQAKGCAGPSCCYGPLGCGSLCCDAGNTCCGGDCCPIEGGSCCFDAFCCGEGYQCCDPEKCCPSDWQCCAAIPGVAAQHCCPPETTCCTPDKGRNGCCP
jgi:hypothetical protein